MQDILKILFLSELFYIHILAFIFEGYKNTFHVYNIIKKQYLFDDALFLIF